MEDLRGAVAIVTGGGSGIGRGTALTLAEEGASVVVADVDARRAVAVATEVEDAGGAALGVHVDVSRTGDLQSLRERTLKRFGRVDVLMNNVGVRADGRPEDVPLDEWARVLDVNVLSVVRGLHVFVPLLLAQGRGHVVNTASTNPLWPYSYDRLPYTASKGALVALTEGLALYLRPRGVGVTCFCPSGVDTNLREHVRIYGADPPRLRKTGLPDVSRDPRHAGRCVVDAIKANRVYAYTNPAVPELLARRAQDLEGFMRDQIAAFSDTGTNEQEV